MDTMVMEPVDSLGDPPEAVSVGSGDNPERDALRAEVRRISENEKVSLAEIAKQVGRPSGTFSLWLGGKYGGHNEPIDDAVRRWLAQRAVAERTRLELPDVPAFVLTRTAEAMLGVLEYAQHAPDLATVSGAAGVGKTTAIREYQARGSNVWVLTAEPVLSTPRALLDTLAELLGVNEVRGIRMSRALAERLRGTRGLLVLDEAQHVPLLVLEQLRTLHDVSGVGMVLAGNERVHSRIEGGSRRPEFAQLFSRVGRKFVRSQATLGDIRAVLGACGVHDEAVRKLLTAVGRKPGALRQMLKVLRIGRMQAAAAGEPLGARHVELAYESLANRVLDAEVAA